MKYTNDAGKEAYKDIKPGDVFSDFDFHTPEYKFEDDVQVALHTNLGSLTVLDRVTGFENGRRDIETGYRDTDGKFWLASGGYDVRESGAKTIQDAIQWVKDRANTCNPYPNHIKRYGEKMTKQNNTKDAKLIECIKAISGALPTSYVLRIIKAVREHYKDKWTKPKDHEIGNHVNQLRNIAEIYGQSQQLREHLGTEVYRFIKLNTPPQEKQE